MEKLKRLILVSAFFTLPLIGCGGERKYATECELERVLPAVDRFDKRLSDGQFDEIYADYLKLESGEPLFTKGAVESSLKYLRETYGKIRERRLVSVSVNPSENQCESVVTTNHELIAEKGRYVLLQYWHTLDEGTKLAYFSLLEYDENGKLYLKLRLHHGLGKDDVSETKIPVQ